MGLKGFLQGKWLGHPLHPALVHVPVGLWMGALIFDLLAWAGIGGNLFMQVAFYAIALGLAGAAISIPPGLADWVGIKREKPAWTLGLMHMLVNFVAVGVWGWNLWARWGHYHQAVRPEPIELWLSVLGVALLLVGAWFGKRMVFDQGTSVARLSKQNLRVRAKQARSNVPEE